MAHKGTCLKQQRVRLLVTLCKGSSKIDSMEVAERQGSGQMEKVEFCEIAAVRRFSRVHG